MVAIAHPAASDRRPLRPHLRLVPVVAVPAPHLVPGSGRLPDAVYRRRRVGVLLALGFAVLAVAGVLTLRNASSTTELRTGIAAPVVVHDPVAYGASGHAPPAGAVYVVQPGDTLWSIARDLDPTGDVRAEVDRLAALNGDAALTAGQRLRLTPDAGP